MRHKVQDKLAPGLESLQALLAEKGPDSVDMGFIDADKRGYDAYYELLLQLVRPGGLIIVDNVLWYGKVADSQVGRRLGQRQGCLMGCVLAAWACLLLLLMQLAVTYSCYSCAVYLQQLAAAQLRMPMLPMSPPPHSQPLACCCRLRSRTSRPLRCGS